MKYVALLSGGKDSCYNLVHCEKNGHQLVAAASLRPEAGKEELDSYMYQTVGQDAIEFVSRALDVPLYRKVIAGGALEQGVEYGERRPTTGGISGDETEDLFDLLSTVKVHHPDVKGVSVGAILSNYQRVRVEHVCRRLSLTPLCYLWQRNQGELLDEMIEAGMDVVLIKVAGIGLTTAHLGKSLSQMRDTLYKLNTLYGSHICGEGGEYESLTLDCPLFKQKIDLVATETVIHSDNDFATVAFLRVKDAVLRTKIPKDYHLTMPPLLEESFSDLSSSVHDGQEGIPALIEEKTHLLLSDIPSCSVRRVNNWVAISNVHAEISSETRTVEDEVKECFSLLKSRLSEHGLSLWDCANINIFINSIDLFARINAVYSSYFGTSPPGRACVAVNLPETLKIVLDCIAFKGSSAADRLALHVQSLSYWAPANIGPYSQAIMADDNMFISGQIGLIPSSLSLPVPQSFGLEFALASQHAERISSALKVGTGGRWPEGVGYTQATIYWLCRVGDIHAAKGGHRKLQAIESNLNIKLNGPTLFVVVKELPKGAIFEKQVLLHNGRAKVEDEDGEVYWELRSPSVLDRAATFQNGGATHWVLITSEKDTAACAVLFVKGDISSDLSSVHEAVSGLSAHLTTTLSTRYFYTRHSAANWKTLTASLFSGQPPPTVPIPCTLISDGSEDDWDAALCIMCV